MLGRGQGRGILGQGEATGFRVQVVTSISENQRTACLLLDASLYLQRIPEGEKYTVGASPLGAGMLAAHYVGHTDSRK